MKEGTTAKIKLSLSKTMFLVTAILFIWSSPAAARHSLRDHNKEYGMDLLAGRWTAKIDDGITILLVYKWELNGHLMTVDLKMGEYAARGMIFYAPDGEKVTQVSVDNMGSRSKGTFGVRDDGKLVSKSEHVNAEGKVQKSATIYEKMDAKTMKIELYGLNENGELNDEPLFTMDFKRQPAKKKDPAKK